ncbi:MAG: type II toxin-antitoxin system RelE/ParE family toxin [Draconibacterium sp.]
MNFSIYTTPVFVRDLKRLSKKYPSIKNDYYALISSLKTNPEQGQALGNDCYKIRMAISSKNKGKSGGSRVITCVKILAESVFLLMIYDKSEKEDFKDNELDEVLKRAGLL